MADIKYLSTTALAKQLAKEPKEVFVLLARAHWMVKVDDRWQLTEKGKFEGGIYLSHPKYGEYVGWPEAIVGHGIWQDLPEAPLTASQIGQKLKLPARLLNLVLAELGWQTPGPKGWVLSDSGRLMGGQQQRAEDSSIPFVTWPESLLARAELVDRAHKLSCGESLDGRTFPSPQFARLGSWLYLQGLAFGINQSVSDAPLPLSFYLPTSQISIQVWPASNSAADIKAKLEQQQWLKGRRAIELDVADLDDLAKLDNQMPPALLNVGLAVY